MNLLPRHRRSQKGGGHKARPLPIEMPPMIKVFTAKPSLVHCLLSFQSAQWAMSQSQLRMQEVQLKI